MITKIVIAVMACVIWLFSMCIVHQSTALKILRDQYDALSDAVETALKEVEEDDQ